MSWLKLDDGFPEHEKLLDISDRAFRLHVTALCQCAKNLTDGLIDGKRLKIAGAIVGGPITRAIRELVTQGLWQPEGDGYRINDYLHYNPSSSEVKQLREKRSEAGRRGGKRSGLTRQAHAGANGEASASWRGRSTGVEPRPVPSPSINPGAVSSYGSEQPPDLHVITDEEAAA